MAGLAKTKRHDVAATDLPIADDLFLFFEKFIACGAWFGLSNNMVDGMQAR